MGSNLLFAICVMIVVNVKVKCGDVIPVRKCATLYADANFEGSTFTLIDFDQSVNLVREYRHSLNGWNRTGSISVENGCTLEFCADTYFVGKCEKLTGSNVPSFLVSTGVNSVECTCKRKCSCSDIHVPRDFYGNGPVARAYLEGGCDTCNNEYLPVFVGTNFPKEYTTRVRAFVIADGCEMKISKAGGGYVYMQGPVVNLANHRSPSFYAQCPKSPSLTKPINEAQLLRLPASHYKLYELVQSKKYTAEHPGIQAALRSAQNRRSAANVYIVYFGDIHPYWTGFPKCGRPPSDRGKIIWEYNMLVPMPDLGISTELRLIVVPVTWTADPIGKAAALEKHLSAINDLDNAIPNAVIVQDDQYNSNLWLLSRKFQTVVAMIPRLLDVSKPNIIFMLNKFDVFSDYRRQPDKVLIPLLEKEIRKTWSFPIIICVAPNYINGRDILHRNGYERMSNMEYWPRNLEMSLKYICERGDDPLGRETLKAYFQDNITPRYSVKP